MSRVLSWMGVLVFMALAVAPAAAAEGKKAKKERPIAKIDRTRVVGAPVLGDDARPGLYVWLEDGAFQIAAVPPSEKGGDGKRRRRPASYAVRVASTKPMKTSQLGDFRGQSGGRSTRITVDVREAIARGRFETDGDVTISDASRSGAGRLRIYVGPLAKPAAATVEIGRF